MKYDIAHSCGCVETVDIFGTNVHGERDKKAARMEASMCAKCKAAKGNATAGMAELIGSDKQIAWAADIRRDMIKSVESLSEKVLAEPGHTDNEIAIVKGNFDKVFANLSAETSAKWFIENNNLKAMSVFRTMLNK